MTANALVKEADLKRMAKVAKQTGIEIAGMIIRVAPDIPAIHSPSVAIRSKGIRL